MREWGKKFIDRRNWREYNEQLVVRGEFLLNYSFNGALKEQFINIQELSV
ncbi:MAG: hypothetical protein QXU18_03050 [Thermoplasmatales archaeon]